MNNRIVIQLTGVKGITHKNCLNNPIDDNTILKFRFNSTIMVDISQEKHQSNN